MFPAVVLMIGAGCQPAESQLTLRNASDFDRTDAPVSISVTELTQRGMLPSTLWAPYDADGEVIPYQYDDLDQDGQPDELFFLVGMATGATQQVVFKPALSDPDFATRTHVRMGKKTEGKIEPVTEAKRLNTLEHSETEANFQFEGIGWENEQVAFRNYMDLRNGMDIFGKTKSEMVLDRVGLDGDDSYHSMLDWGMDILKVGNSLGAGSVALWYQDSLVRLTGADADARIVFEGPLRSRFELRFRGVELGGKQVDVVHTIDIVAGTAAYDATVTLSDTAGITVVVGIVDLHELEAQSVSVAGRQGLYTYGMQSENKDSLGMALSVDVTQLGGLLATDSISEEIPDTYALRLSPQSPSYRFYAGWQPTSDQFATQAAFNAYLTQGMWLQASPIKVQWGE
jgi:hypothetical protein